MKKVQTLVAFAGLLALGVPFLALADTQVCTPYALVETSGADTEVSGGTFATSTYQSPLWTPAFPGSLWIWDAPFVTDPVHGEVKMFVTHFSLPGAAASSTLSIAADDYFKVNVNGTDVASEFGDDNFITSNLHVYHVQNLLAAGANTLSIEVTNAAYFFGGLATATNNPGGLLFRLDVDGSSCVTAPAGGSSGSTGGASHGGGSAATPSPLSFWSQPIGTTTTPASPGGSIAAESGGTTGTVSGSASGSSEGTAMGTESDTATDSQAETVATEKTTDQAAALGFLAFEFSWSCALIGILLAVLMVAFYFGIMRNLVREIVFYGIYAVVVIAFLAYLERCALPYFIVAALVVMLYRAFRGNR